MMVRQESHVRHACNRAKGISLVVMLALCPVILSPALPVKRRMSRAATVEGPLCL